MSYLKTKGYIPSGLNKILQLVSPTGDKKTGVILSRIFTDDLLNMSIKLGFTWQARDFIFEIALNDNPDAILANFYLSNFIYNTKAFLDSVAISLNDFYKLGFEGGDIDLVKGSFVNTLEKKSPILSQYIQKNRKWINEVVDWRMKIIHRFSILIGSYHTMFDQKGVKQPLRMPAEPISFSAMPEYIYNKGESINVVFFIDKWLNSAKELFESTCEDLAEFIVKENKTTIG